MSTTSSKGCSPLFADSMVSSKGTFLKAFRVLEANGVIPDLNKLVPYKVYSWEGDSLCAHRSMVFTADDKRFFIVDLAIETCEDGKNHVCPRAYKAPDKLRLHQLKLIGVVETIGALLMNIAYKKMKSFGNYSKLCNNCRSFCNSFVDGLETIGLKKATETLT